MATKKRVKIRDYDSSVDSHRAARTRRRNRRNAKRMTDSMDPNHGRCRETRWEH